MAQGSRLHIVLLITLTTGFSQAQTTTQSSQESSQSATEGTPSSDLVSTVIESSSIGQSASSYSLQSSSKVDNQLSSISQSVQTTLVSVSSLFSSVALVTESSTVIPSAAQQSSIKSSSTTSSLAAPGVASLSTSQVLVAAETSSAIIQSDSSQIQPSSSSGHGATIKVSRASSPGNNVISPSVSASGNAAVHSPSVASNYLSHASSMVVASASPQSPATQQPQSSNQPAASSNTARSSSAVSLPAASSYTAKSSSAVPTPGKRLQCYHCEYKSDMPSDQRFCNKTLRSCSSDKTYCTDYHTTNMNNTEVHGKGCGDEEMCKDIKATCDKRTTSMKLKDCNLHCCQTDKCNEGTSSAFQNACSAFSVLQALFVSLYFLK